ncbi:putative DUF4175 domain-containing protein [Azospirillaceae bacterium]
MFNFVSILFRWVFSLTVVCATYNPTGYSYYHWIVSPVTSPSNTFFLKLFFGILLTTIYCVYGTAIWRSVGPVGISLVMAAFMALIYVLSEHQLLDLRNNGAIATVFNALIATLLTAGVSWSHIRTRLTGHVDAKDIASR